MVEIEDIKEYLKDEYETAKDAVERATEAVTNTRRQAPQITLAIARGRLELLEQIIKNIFE